MAMDQHTGVGFPATLISIFSALFAFIMKDVQGAISICAGLVAICSGVMAMRYYYFATKEKIKR